MRYLALVFALAIAAGSAKGADTGRPSGAPPEETSRRIPGVLELQISNPDREIWLTDPDGRVSAPDSVPEIPDCTRGGIIATYHGPPPPGMFLKIENPGPGIYTLSTGSTGRPLEDVDVTGSADPGPYCNAHRDERADSLGARACSFFFRSFGDGDSCRVGFLEP